MHAGRRARSTPAETRGESRPRRRPDRHEDHAAARRAIGRTNVGASSPHDDEPAALEHDLAAELVLEVRSIEHTFVDAPSRSVLEPALLPALGVVAVASGGRNYDELLRDTPCLDKKPLTFLVLEVAVEVTREDAVELTVFERESKRVPLLEPRGRSLLARQLEHALARIDPDDVAAKMPGQEARTAGDVQRVRGRKTPDQALEQAKLAFPARPLAVGVQALAQPPVVVLGRAPVVVRLHTFVEYGRWICHSSRCRTSPRDVTPGRLKPCGPRSPSTPTCSTFTRMRITTGRSSHSSGTTRRSSRPCLRESPVPASGSTSAAMKGLTRGSVQRTSFRSSRSIQEIASAPGIAHSGLRTGSAQSSSCRSSSTATRRRGEVRRSIGREVRRSSSAASTRASFVPTSGHRDSMRGRGASSSARAGR